MSHCKLVFLCPLASSIILYVVMAIEEDRERLTNHAEGQPEHYITCLVPLELLVNTLSDPVKRGCATSL